MRAFEPVVQGVPRMRRAQDYQVHLDPFDRHPDSEMHPASPPR